MEGYLHSEAFQVPIYKIKFVVVLSNDTEKLSKLIPEWDKNEDPYAHCMLDRHEEKAAVFVILNFHSEEDKITNGIICHEAIHAAGMILNRAEVISSFDNDEPLCYLAEWISNNIYAFIKKQNMKIECL